MVNAQGVWGTEERAWPGLRLSLGFLDNVLPQLNLEGSTELGRKGSEAVEMV